MPRDRGSRSCRVFRILASLLGRKKQKHIEVGPVPSSRPNHPGASRAEENVMGFNPTQITIHHTVTSEYATPLDINRMHKARGFSGIGYHALVYRAKGGDVIIGDGRDDENTGAHTKGANSKTLGVAVAGDFQNAEPDGEQYGVLVGQCLAWCLKYSISPNDIYGHRDAPGGKTATVCPGLIDVEHVRRMVRAAFLIQK